MFICIVANPQTFAEAGYNGGDATPCFPRVIASRAPRGDCSASGALAESHPSHSRGRLLRALRARAMTGGTRAPRGEAISFFPPFARCRKAPVPLV